MTTEEKGNERLARVETELESIKTLLQRLDTKFDILNTAYVPRNEINIMFTQRDKDIQDLKEELKTIKEEKSQSKNLLPTWVSVVISAGALAVAIITIIAT